MNHKIKKIGLGLLCSGLFLASSLSANPISAKKKKEEIKDPLKGVSLSAFKFRSVGPALTSGRIADFAVNPDNRSEFYVATASGGVWKTVNSGTTFSPIFDSQGSYSIGVVEMDPNNHDVIWVGTGENNNQRSVAYGDGVYKSNDGGASWEHLGLKNSEHIGRILIDPRNSDVVYVAAIGPLWSNGGDRGLYKTTDGGKTWENVLEINDGKYTGVNDVEFDPTNPDVLYAAAYQRRRHVFTWISGGPESALYKSTDGGKTWEKAQKGLPGTYLGRMDIEFSKADPSRIYLIAEAQDGKGGVFVTDNKAASWHKVNSRVTSGNYYQELVSSPHDKDVVYSLDTYLHRTVDGGKSWDNVQPDHAHVDNHALYIDPKDPNYMLNGNDGGVYESYDGGKTWEFKSNLPVTQFYKVTVDNAKPFYNIYGGTQDNFSLGGPSQTLSVNGITNSDWFVTLGGDGFESAVDPDDPNIVYAQYQYGNLFRYNKLTGESVDIKPRENEGEEALVWNWDAPLLVSPHNGQTLYFASNKLFKTTDRGNTWTAISGDLTRKLDRNTFEVMDQVWGMDAIMKNQSTTVFGNIVALDESPVEAGLLFVGTDDGLIHTSTNDGKDWTTVKEFDGVPDMTYVNMLKASQHDKNVVYAAFNNHKRGDFKPYLYVSTDAGKSWKAIQNNLPERGSVYSIAEDHKNPNILFAGTEFGVFVSINKGESWTQLKSGLPTVAIRDMDIQKEEDDLVLATFGRGFYVLDDYSALREISENVKAKDAHIFESKTAYMYPQTAPWGNYGKSYQGDGFFATSNPAITTYIKYYVKDGFESLASKRKKEAKKLEKEAKAVTYPTYEEYKAEIEEAEAFLLFTITDEAGDIVRKLKEPIRSGIQTLTWDFKMPTYYPVRANGKANAEVGSGLNVAPGTYHIRLDKVVNTEYETLVEDYSFDVAYLQNPYINKKEAMELAAFRKKISDLGRALQGVNAVLRSTSEKADQYVNALNASLIEGKELLPKIRNVQLKLDELSRKMNGDGIATALDKQSEPGLNSRFSTVAWGQNDSYSAPTANMRRNYQIVADSFEGVYNELKALIDTDIKELDSTLSDSGAPYFQGKIPYWQND